MKVQKITGDYVLFDNGKKLTCLFSYSEETPAYLYYVDFPALLPQLEGKELADEVRIYRPSRMVRSKEFDDTWEMTAGVILQFGNNRDKFYLPLYKKANPAYKKLDIPLGKVGFSEFLYLPCQYAHAQEPVRNDPRRAMKIVLVTEKAITFSNGKKITYDHSRDCCEYNYADFEQIDDLGRHAVSYENELVFEAVERGGFRFGNRGGAMTFIPCYSVQNGYYTKEIDIFYGGRTVLHVEDGHYYEPELRIIRPGK